MSSGRYYLMTNHKAYQKTDAEKALKKQNEILYILRYICQTTSTHLTSGAFASAFMVFIGLSTRQISIINFTTNLGLFAASIIVILAFSYDPIGLSIIRIGSLGNILTPGCLLLVSFFSSEKTTLAFISLVILCFVANTMFSMRNSAELNAVPLLFGRSRYAQLMGKCGYIGGSVTLVVSCTTIFFLRADQSIRYYRIFFAISTILMCFYFVLALYLRCPKDLNPDETAVGNLRDVITPKYLKSSLPHLTRGIGAAAMMLWPAVIIARLDLSPLQSSLLVPLGILAEIAGSVLFVYFSKRLRPGTMTLMSFAVSAAFMLLTPVIRTVPTFFLSYSTYSLMNSGFGKALMQCFVYSCDKKELSLMSSLHVLYYAAAFCPASLIFGHYMDQHTTFVMSIGAAIYLLSGLLFHIYYYTPIDEKNAGNHPFP